MHIIYRRKIQRKSIYLFLFVLIVLGPIVYLDYHQQHFSTYIEPDAGLTYFYSLQTTTPSVWFVMIMLVFSTNILIPDIILEKANQFSYMIKTRLGSKKYFNGNYSINFIYTFCFVLLIQIFLLAFINLFLSNISFNFAILQMEGYDPIYSRLSDNLILNLITYIVMTSLGYAVFSNLILSMRIYLKNVYFIRGIGLIIGIVLSVVPILLGVFFYKVLNNYVITYVCSLANLTFLISPSMSKGFGMLSYNVHPIISYVLCMVTFIVVSFVQKKHSDKKELQNA